MIVKNEEGKLGRCLESVKDIVDEIIIIDTGSTDKTKEIAKKYGCKIYDYKWENDFSKARNFSISKSTCDWNLILDADEWLLDDEKKDEIQKFINNKENQDCIGQIKIVNYFEENGETRKSNTYVSRLVPKDIYFEGSIHEQLNCSYKRKKVNLSVGHDGYLNTNKFQRNIELILKELNEKESDSYLLYQAAKTYFNNCQYEISKTYFERYFRVCDISNEGFSRDALILYLYNLIKTDDIEEGLDYIDEIIGFMANYCDFHFACGIYFTELISRFEGKYVHLLENIEICYKNALAVGEDDQCVEGTGSFLALYNLGVYYELTGDIKKAKECYKEASGYGYGVAQERYSCL